MADKSLKVVFSAVTKDFQTQLAAVNKDLKTFGSDTNRTFGQIAKSSKELGLGMLAAGAVITGAVTLSAKKFADLGEQLLQLKAKTGIGVETLSELKYAADVSGSSIDDLGTNIKDMDNVLTDAGKGVKSAQEKLQGLNLTMADLVGLSPEQQFMKIASAVGAIQDPAQRSAAAVDFFGRSGTSLLPMMDNLDELRRKAHELGVTMTEDVADKAGELHQTLEDLQASLDGLKVAAGEAAAPALKELADSATKTIERLSQFVKDNPGTVDAMLKFGLAITGIGGALVGLGTIIPPLVRGINDLNVAFKLLSKVNPILLGISTAVDVLAYASVQLNSARGDIIDNLSEVTRGEQEYIKAIRGEAFSLEDIKSAIADLEHQGSLTVWEKISLGMKQGLSIQQTFAKGTFDLTDAEQKVLDVMKAALPELEKQSEANAKLAESEEAADAASEAEAQAIAASVADMKSDMSDFTEQAKQAADDREQAEIDAIDAALEAASAAHDKKLSFLSDEYDAIVKNIDASLAGALAPLQSQIDTINKQQAADDKRYQDKENSDKIASLKSQINAETDAKKKADLQQQLADFLAQIARDNQRQQRQDQIAALQLQMDDLKAAAQKQQDAAQADYDAKVKLENDAYKVFADEKDKEKTRLDQALKDTQNSYDADLKAFKTLLDDKTKLTSDYVTAYNALVSRLAKDANLTLPSGASPTPAPGASTETTLPGFDTPGVVPGPIGRPVMVQALGGERFLGAASVGASAAAPVVNINNPVFLTGDDITARAFARRVKDLISQDNRRTSFAGVNPGYFGGSSAP
jgi:hypothetical protein